MNKAPFLLFFAAILLIFSVSAYSNDTEAAQYINAFNRGNELFSRGEYGKAISDFTLAADTGPSHIKAPAYLMLGRCHIALEQYGEARKIFDFIIDTYSDTPEYQEALYQSGRIDYIEQRFEKSIDLLNSFLEISGDHPLRGNAIYWIGESLFSLGHIDEAAGVFRIVTDKYQESFKYEAAKYKLELISLGKREEELVKLLKWSHEEALRERELFLKKEKEYNQAILSYQKKLAILSGEDTNSLLISLREANNVLKKQLELQEQVIKRQNEEIEALRKNPKQEKPSDAAELQGSTTPASVPAAGK